MPAGAEKMRTVLRSLKRPDCPEMPKPGDAWGAWVEYRLKRLEDRQQWMVRLILAALMGQFALEIIKLI